MSRIRYNNQLGALGASLTSSGTTITFGAAPDFATISGSDYVPLILDPPSGLAPAASYEIVHLTAYTAGDTTGTISRGQEGTSGHSHSSGAAWMCGPTALSESEEATRAIAAEELLAPLDSPELTGDPTAPTQSPGDNSTHISTTAYSDAAVETETTRAEGVEADLAPLNSPTFTGDPKAPTQDPGDGSTNLATTEYSDDAVAAESERAQGAESDETNRATAAEELLAPLADPTFTGNPKAPTPTTSDNDTSIATSAMVHAVVAAALTGQGVPFFIREASGSYANRATGAPFAGSTDLVFWVGVDAPTIGSGYAINDVDLWIPLSA